MGKRIALVAVGLMMLAVGTVLAVPQFRIPALAWTRGETFYRGMPLSYWIEALDDPDPNQANRRYEGILAVSHDPVAIPALRRRLKDSVPLLRHMAAVELSGFGDAAREAVPDLQAMLKDEDRSCREAAADALAKIDPSALNQAKAP